MPRYRLVHPQLFSKPYVQCVLVFIGSLAATIFLVSPNQGTVSQSLMEFDFSAVPTEWAGPDVGQRIDLRRLKDRNGGTLLNTLTARPVMLITVDPQCGLCKLTIEQMQEISQRVREKGIRYCVVSFTSPQPASFFRFADSLNLDVSAFLWAIDEEQPAKSLSSMTIPSHLLLDSNGRILGKWPGSNEDQSIRRRITNQILTDVTSLLAAPQIN